VKHLREVRKEKKMTSSNDSVSIYWKDIDSSMIEYMIYSSYDGKSKLEVGFNTGTVYEYHNVSRKHFIEVFTSDSVGKSFNSVIRDRYDYVKLFAER
jgi:hypothetical protein